MTTSEIFDIPQTPFQAVMQEVADTTSVFDSPGGRLHAQTQAQVAHATCAWV